MKEKKNLDSMMLEYISKYHKYVFNSSYLKAKKRIDVVTDILN